MKNNIERNSLDTFTYEIESQGKLKVFVKKVVRKLLWWLLKPIGDKQNSLNHQIYAQVEEICNEQEKAKEEFNKLLFTNIKLNSELEFMKSNINYKFRSNLSSAKNDIDVMGNRVLKEQLEILKSDKNSNSIEQLSKIGQTFSTMINESILKQDSDDVIIILCNGLKCNKETEAIRKEAWNLYQILNRWSKYHVKLISIEEQIETEYEGNVVYIAESLLEKYFSNLNIKLLIAVESDISIIYRAKSLFFKYKSIIRATGQNPLAGIQPDLYEHIRHLNDLGFQKYDVYSYKAESILKEAGFKNIGVRYPVMDLHLWKYQQKNIRGKLKIGFASAPMGEEQWMNRGMDLLSTLMLDCPEYEFEILWRNSKVPVPDKWKQMPQCKVYYGKQDMASFYANIHVLLIPYVSINHNHACSLSALEAMLQGIPVVATNISGISDIVEKFGLGEISGITSLEIQTAFQKIKSNYSSYTSREKVLLLQKELSEENIVAEIENYADMYLPKMITTLGEWKRDLELYGKTLVKGPEEIKAYYSQFEIAENYNADRFMQFPENCIDLLERTSIGNIIQDRFKGARVKILDIAPGDGRIMQEDLKYGDCLGVDSSEAMLRLMKDRFRNFDNLKTKSLDYFKDDLKEQFDVITTFRYIRHFEYFQRKDLYQKIKNNLKNKGILIFDVPNIKFEFPVRNQNGWDKYNIYDVFTTKEEMIAELEENGFKIEYIIAIGNNLMEHIPEECMNEPITWTFGVVKA